MSDKQSRQIIRVKKHKIEKKKSRVLYIVLSVIAALAVAAAIVLIARNKKAEENMSHVMDESDALDYYVGPEECEDRGEWVDPSEYYGLFEDDGAPVADVVSQLFSDGDSKGIVPAGVMLKPVLMTYDDFEPYGSLGEYGFFDSYACTSSPGAVELQLGINGDLSLSGGYELEKEGLIYSASCNMDCKDMSYYTENLFDYSKLGEEPSGQAAYYGYICPVFEFDYSGEFEAMLYEAPAESDMPDAEETEDYSPKTYTRIKGVAEGQLGEGLWNYTLNLSGQGSEVFPNGELYLRCRIPCEIHKETVSDSASVEATEVSDYSSYINIYFSVEDVRIGTRLDCMPPEL